MSSDFGYINARVRGLTAKLLEPEFFTQALGESDLKSFAAVLAQTLYKQDVEEAQARSSGLKMVDQAVARNFYRTTRSILNFSDGAAHEQIALVLRRYDLANLKAIARAKHADRSAEEIQAALLPAGEFKPAVLESLASEADLPSCSTGAGSHPSPPGPSLSARGRSLRPGWRPVRLRTGVGSCLLRRSAGEPQRLARAPRLS